MSLQYKLFDEPKTFEEFVEKVKRKGGCKIDVYVETRPYLSSSDVPLHKCEVGVRRSDMELKLDDDFSFFGYPLDKERVAKEAVHKALNYATRLEELGIDATINGKPVDEIRTMSSQMWK